ncbi:MAG: methyltransferase domain-containing protein [Polyangiaceae bacterium]|nr:methyltransferase domain-containing protein [Polyangiaceae bacterium]
MSSSRRAKSALEQAFGAAAPEHFAWQTEHPYVAARERALVRAAFLPLAGRVLDLGCGEGATLVHLGARGDADVEAVGVDLFEDKLAFAREVLPGCRFVAASADALPFESGSFDQVIVRDLVHHLEAPERSFAEIARVLRPGGRLDVLEPCGRNPLVLLHALSQRAERGELRSTPARLERLLAPGFVVTARTRHQALPLHRIVFHPRFGLPRLAARAWAASAVAGVEALAARALPRALWAYMHLRATRAPG